ncbi:HipA domain-containing protein [Nocardia sp. NPDC058519]|uniref:HipA domain-containing protein n=1 Tax=Nocardia sp. NPDC058519 TaxID=3346535 RepID=UPI003649B56B
MTEVLHAWLEGYHAGTFTRGPSGHVRFDYSESAPITPISLSLPRTGGATRRAAANFLDNLLPDNAAARYQMASVYRVASVDTFDLLSQAGGDVAGGLVLTAEEGPPDVGPLLLDPAGDEDVAARIAALKRSPDQWVGAASPARFSLAGTQGKFALADIGGEWYWSNATVPSTHIVKPARPGLSGLEDVEAMALGLASKVGAGAPQAQVMRVLDQSAYLVERFDRVRTGQVAARLHAEDIAQAMGKGPAQKYDVSAQQVIRLLREQVGTEIAYAFVRQLAVNTFLGNADAHAKNYSLLLRPDEVVLSPMYDVVPVGLYPQFDQKLAMGIGGARRAAEVRLPHWRKLARTSGLVEDRVVELVTSLAHSLQEAVDAVEVGSAVDEIARSRELIGKNIASIAAPGRSVLRHE